MSLLDNVRGLFREKPDTSVHLEQEYGETGTEIYGGYISGEEYNNDLTGTAKFDIYDRMRKGDAAVAAALKVLKLPLRSANWFVQPASDDEKHKMHAAFVEHNLMEAMDNQWDDFLRESLLMLDYGVMVFEKVFDYVEFEGQQLIGWKKFAPRLPKTILRWELDDGEFGIVQQLTRKAQGEAQIEGDKLLIFVNEREGENWEGVSVLRTAYKHWFYKDTFEMIDAMAFERQGLGVPYVQLPKGANAKDRQQAKTIAKNLRVNEKAYITFPEGYEVGFLDMKAKNTRDPKESIAHHQRSIVLNVLAQFLMLGAGENSGSRALSQDHSAFFYDSLQSVAKNIKDVINKHAIKQLIDINFPGTTEYPKLTVDDIGNIDKKQLADAINTLIGAKVIRPDDELEKYVRKEMDLPDMPEDMEGQPRDTDPGEDNDNEPATAAEPNAKKKDESQTFAEDFEPWRALTMAEKKVNFNNLKKKMDRAEEKVEGILRRAFKGQKSELLEKIEEAVSNQDYKAIQRIATTAPKEYRKELVEKMKEYYNFGKNAAAAEMKTRPPATPREEVNRISAQANIIADQHDQQVMTKAKIQAIDALNKGKSKTETMSLVRTAVSDAIVKVTRNTSSIAVGGSINDGRRLTQERNKDDIYALQRSELLDDRTCNFCMSMDGRIVSLKDPWSRETVLHSNCRGIWVEILTDEEEKPAIAGIPKSVASRYQGINDFKQPPSPTVKKDSAAADQVRAEYKKEIARREKKIKEYKDENKFENRIEQHQKEIDRMKRLLDKLD